MAVYFISVAVVISIVSAGQYAWSTWRGLSRPNPISWFFWGSVPIITFLAQLEKGIGLVSLVSLVLGLTNLSIMGLAIYKYRLLPHFTPSALWCTFAASLGIVLWILTDQAELAIVFSILTDIFACIPTLIKTYRDPDSEYPMPYMLSAIVMVCTLCSVQHWQFAAYSFALYALLSNVLIYLLAVTSYRPAFRG